MHYLTRLLYKPYSQQGKYISGVDVASITHSISSAATPEFWSRSCMANTAISEVANDLSLSMRLSLIPVLVVIHSSDVSTIFSSVLLSRIVLGTYPPTAVITVDVLILSFNKSQNVSVYLNVSKGPYRSHRGYSPDGKMHELPQEQMAIVLVLLTLAMFIPIKCPSISNTGPPQSEGVSLPS